jgi:hypothetical protein
MKYRVAIEGTIEVYASSEEDAWDRAVARLEKHGIRDFLYSRSYVVKKVTLPPLRIEDDSDNSSKKRK